MNRTTEYVFDVKGRLAYLNARNPKGTGNGVQDQKTYYVYGDSVSAARPTKIVYPDTQDTVSGDNANDGYIISVGQNDTDHVAIAYDRLGRKVTSTDQRDVVHAYAYDSAGRLSSDDADTQADPLPAGVDNAVVKLGRAYDDVGRLQTITSYNPSDTVVNETKVAFDAWSNVSEARQDHSGAAGGGEPAVGYTYQDDASGGVAKYVRLEKITYPGASREVYYRYGSTGGTSDVLSRLDNLADSSGGTTKYAEYSYLGAGTIAKVAHPAVTNGLTLSYKGAAAGSYAGFDRFGRVVDQRWQNNTPTVKDQFKYGHDRASNRTWREVAPDGGNPTGFDEYYTYDGLHRLERSARGTLSGSPYSGVTSPTKTQDFGLEALGNWKTFKEDDDATLDWDVLDQSRLHNKVNEIDNDDNHANAPSGSISGGSWILPVYDAAGNMTAGPRPGKEDHRHWYIWDAWNRLAAVWMDDGDNQREITGEDPDDILMAEYRYDALHRRIAKIVPNGENWDRTDYYYTPGGQVAEERFEDAQANKETPAVPRNYQYVWDIRYIHAAVLRDADTDSDGDVLDSGGSERLYYTQDANFNVTALVETDGDIAERYVYDPYGKRTIYDDDWSDEIAWANSKKNEILFTGHRLNVESGLYYAGARYYDPTLGYWIGREAEYANGLNLYQYVESNPCRFTDPDGLAIYDTTNMPMREGPRGDIPVELPADAPDSAGSVAGIKKDAYTPTLSEAALEALATSSATAYVECVCKCGMAMNDKAEAFVKKHAAEAAAAAAAEAAAAAASTPVGKGYAAPGDVQSTSLATKIAVRTGMGTSPAVYHGMRILGRVGYYPVVITAVGIGLAELGVEGWCAYQCAKDTNFRVGS